MNYKKVREPIGVADLLGERIRVWRKSKFLKGYELAKILSISQGSLSDIENNKSLPSAETIARLHKLTELNVIWLLTGEGPKIRIENNQEELVNNLEDNKLKGLIEMLTAMYNEGDSKKVAHLEGFLMGAAPQKF